jgi:hypothetical protein
MTIIVVDGLGGGIGSQIIEQIRKTPRKGLTVIALGTNAVATQRMLESGADRGASGENAIKVSISLADAIIGPIGIILPDSMLGEITPVMAQSIALAHGKKFLIPLQQSHVNIVGAESKPLAELIDEAVKAMFSE